MIEAVAAPIAAVAPGTLPAGGIVLVTDDERGVAAAAEESLQASGCRVIRVAHSPADESLGASASWRIDFADRAAIGRLMSAVRSEGALVGVIHALPLRASADAGFDAAIWDERLKTEVRGLFLLAQECVDDLARAAQAGFASLVAATGMGGDLASLAAASSPFFAGHGAIAGLVKTLAREWDGVRSRVVDFDPSAPAGTIGRTLAAELLAADHHAEVGYLNENRIALRTVESALDPSGPPRLTVQPAAPIVITGGARGITAAIAIELARRWRPTLLLVGTSPLPAENDPPDVAGIAPGAGIEQRLLEHLRREGRNVGPATLERAFQALSREREIRANLSAMRAAGASVEYASVDVRDADALQATLDGWRDRHGPPVGLIHGAGVIQDKLLRDKTPESFDQVISTKLSGALNLARSIDPEPLRFAAFFSSIAGRFGNRGQSDYAAANDGMNKLAIWLDRRWPGRVVSINWGPWSGLGMVTDLEHHLGQQGLGLIAPEDGSARLADELALGAKGTVEIVVSGDLGQFAEQTEALLRS